MNRREWKFRLGGIAGSWILRLLGATLRFRILGPDLTESYRRKGTPFIFVIWHAWMLPLIYLHRNQGIVVLASDHGDGEYIARIVSHIGYDASRGSSTRGGQKGLRGLLRAIQEGRPVAVTPDGPRGPARQIKEGVLTAAQLSGAPIIAIRGVASSAWRLRTWDRFVIPKPFATIMVEYGGPWAVPRRAGEDLPAIRREIETFLNGEAEEGAP